MLKNRLTELIHFPNPQKYFFKNRKTSISLYSKRKNIFSYKRLVIYTKLIQNIIRLTLRTFRTEKKHLQINLIKTPLIIKLKEKIFDKYITLDTIIEILSKPNNLKKQIDYKVLCYFFTENFEYFTKLKNNNETEKIILLSTVMNLEKYNEGETIIKYDTEVNKFYILISGRVKIYKPHFILKEMMIKDFVIYLNKIKNENDEITLGRIERKNSQIYNINNIKNNKYEYNKLPDCYFIKKFYVEEKFLLDEKKSGSHFGEISLINNERIKTFIIASTECYLVSFNKKDYQDIIKEIEEKNLYELSEKIQSNLIIFKNIDKEIILNYLSINTKIHLENGDYLYKQNDIGNYIYLIMNGVFECSIQLNISNFEKLRKYLNKSSSIFFDWLDKNKKKEICIIDINKFYEDKLKLNGLMKYKIIYNENENKFDSKDNLLNIKLSELIMNDPQKIINIKFRTINFSDILGLEESFECKYRFFSVKCISNEAEVNRIDIGNFIDFCRRKNINFNDIKNLISERKTILINQVRKYINVDHRNTKRLLSFEYDRIKNINFSQNVSPIKIKKTPNLHKIVTVKNIKKNLKKKKLKLKENKIELTSNKTNINSNINLISNEKYPNLHSRNFSKQESRNHLNLSPNSTASSSMRKLLTIYPTKPSIYYKNDIIGKYEKDAKLNKFLMNLKLNEYNYNYLRKQIRNECGIHKVKKRNKRNFSDMPFDLELVNRLIKVKKEKSSKNKSFNDFSFISSYDFSFNDISCSHIHIPVINKRSRNINNFQTFSNNFNSKRKNNHL